MRKNLYQPKFKNHDNIAKIIQRNVRALKKIFIPLPPFFKERIDLTIVNTPSPTHAIGKNSIYANIKHITMKPKNFSILPPMFCRMIFTISFYHTLV